MTSEKEKVFISEADQYLFSQGTHYDIYKKLGAHLSVEKGVKGTYFGVWAPNAREVHIIGTFNDWNEESLVMEKLGPVGIWDLLCKAFCRLRHGSGTCTCRLPASNGAIQSGWKNAIKKI